MNEIKMQIVKRLKKEDIVVNCINIRGYNRENGTIRSIRISLNNYVDSGDNVLYLLKRILDDIQNEFGLDIYERLVEF